VLLASASVTLGLMMSSKRKSEGKRDFRALHEALSLTTLAMVAVHGLALLGDQFFHPGLSAPSVSITTIVQCSQARRSGFP
jgi:hypothetical protein